MSQTLFQRHLGGTGMTQADQVPWLNLRAANGLDIPYVGYALVDCFVGGVHLPEKGVVIVKDECLGPEKGILGMNIIKPLWSILNQSNHPGLVVFRTNLPSKEGTVWAQALTECQRVATRDSGPPYESIVRLPKQSPVVIPPESEMIVWMQVVEGTKNQPLVMVEPLSDNETEFQVARSLVRLEDGRVPCRLCNPNPYSVEIPQRRPLAKVLEIKLDDVRGEQELTIHHIEADVVEVAVRQEPYTALGGGVSEVAATRSKAPA
ncbi:uncharacterized protein LOC114461110 [Gouania willdenowi]|uniref:uncharacterized protein LOC114461110 n=1 Tax=Gouania willdenowi TaxID=441366 RepID=UPI001055529C|nr:uncharacterized protein LOC114461110 [Gouania willdenowi]